MCSLMLYNNETEYFFFFTENWFCFVINIFAERHAKNVYFLVCLFRRMCATTIAFHSEGKGLSDFVP